MTFCQGSMFAGITQEIKLRRLFVQNFDAVLVVIGISAGDAIFAKFYKK